MNIAPEYLSTGFGEFGGKLIAVIFGNLVMIDRRCIFRR